MNKILFSIFLLCAVLLSGQTVKSYSHYIDVADKLKYKDWKNAELNIKKAEEVTLTKDLGDFYLESSEIYKNVGHFDTALDYCVKADNIFIEQKNDKKLAKVYGVFAFIYSQLNDTKRAISYYKKLLMYHEKIHNKEGIIKSLNNLGNAYFAISKLDSSQYYFEQALPVFKHYNDPALKSFIYSNLGKLKFFKGNSVEAENYLLEAKGILDHDSIEDERYRSTNYYTLANFYASTNNAQKALLYAKELGKYTDTKKVNFDNINYLKTLYNAYLLNADYKNASFTFKKYDSIRELLNIEQKAVNVEKIKIKHDYEVQKKIEDLENSKRNTLIALVVIGLLLITIICILLLINYKNKAEKFRLEHKLIEAREKQLDFDNHLKEKLLLQKSMEQSRIEEIFKSILDQIHKLKIAHNDQYMNEVSDIINEIQLNTKQNNWAGFEYHFLNIHESFYKNLDEKHPGLTNYDKKLAAMLKLKLSTKEISDILNVTSKTIENSRTRLRKKMNLTNSKEDLSIYLNGF
ncbi:tetratricopeptide repeat protein [Chryseobacterium polytrichastri]|uniref:Regulatory protein, luxR family n=1 Tax=Chryseobacterium polytrichastri TaxID=1302687 RepID=A0A1M6Y3Z7_9FLAO|nr:tetratricopeptide repeat protein [Chryseobacterium polytrichastri]SHL12967.1 regulatory protein, luxR family [Chryseobacterium polytrichastri]